MLTSITLDTETLHRIDTLAVAEGQTRLWVIQQAVVDAQRTREVYMREVQKGLAQARAGLFATPDEVDAFFAQYGA